MAGSSKFNGFPKQTLKFLKELDANNDKEWFEAHREDYEQYYVAPAQEFVLAAGPGLKELSAGLDYHPDPNGKGSIKKIFTDRRFNPDRPPYKTWLDIIFWEGPLKAKKDNSILGLRLTADGVRWYAGLKHFTPAVKKAYRKALEDGYGEQVQAALDAVRRENPQVEVIGADGFKQVPRGFDAGHPHADLLRHDALGVAITGKHPRELATPAFVDYARQQLERIAPVHRVAVKLLSPLS
jgi:uncharacterized protein (TIGR02453 family)